MLTVDQLRADGCVLNQKMWLGSGWMYCRTCGTYSLHRAFSHLDKGDCYEVCNACDTYTGPQRSERNDLMTTAADILEHAAELTKRYAKTVTTETVPAKVYVLLRNGTVLGVLSTEQRALDEAQALMHTYGGIWQEQVVGRSWLGGWGTVTVEISQHDVR